MKISDARFITSVFSPDRLPAAELPEIALCGRSNVGKSSLINLLLRRRIAKTSATPGRTQSINFILINEAFYFVDLPGYGYANVPERVRHGWRSLIESYLHGRMSLCAVVLIVDARRDPGDDEVLFVQWLERARIPWMLAVTKIDKVPHGRRRQAIAAWERALAPPAAAACSARTGHGADALWKLIEAHLRRKK